MKTITSYSVITGASLGLGRSYALELARSGHNLILVSRKNENLLALCKKIKKEYAVDTVCYETDLTNYNNLKKLTSWINTNYQINLLINNAGIGGTIAFDICSRRYINQLIQLNIRAISFITHELLENLKSYHGNSYILNVSSMAAFCPMGFKSIYPASKRFIQHFSTGLNYELHHTNVNVATVFPGPMKTNPQVTARIDKQGYLAKLSLQSTAEVANISLKKLYGGKTFIIVGLLNKINWILMQIIPENILVPLLSRAFKKELETKNLRHEIAL